MIKVRFQGTKEDIRWLLDVLEEDKRLCISNTSDFYDNYGTSRYKRAYTEVHRNDSENRKSIKENYTR
jgi:hypothetical protein